MTKPTTRQNDQEPPEDTKKPKILTVSSGKVRKGGGKRGRKPSKIDQNAKLERSRQSARDCRARKKQKYQLLEEMVANKESSICALRQELDMYKQWCKKIDQGTIPPEIFETLQMTETDDNTETDSMSPSVSVKKNIPEM
ncbi:cAMP-responsive element-binding protein-like 2 [Asterias rubens]|uniref:cAMP-responsive element-binding protein-like 2 n=1 Tax=Asterias rubens TaxID=7604 RepID=UPI0014552157|nr:cAMP-responsive element-binding protein-like 2 [Asterias rubens]XP_033640404.1 cAMP-responsive element-binding protein-like 2 [Asterias rubens]